MVTDQGEELKLLLGIERVEDSARGDEEGC
jgi:hypothetical protein